MCYKFFDIYDSEGMDNHIEKYHGKDKLEDRSKEWRIRNILLEKDGVLHEVH